MHNDSGGVTIFLVGFAAGALLFISLIGARFRKLQLAAVEKGYAQYVVVDNYGNTRFKWVDEINKVE